MATHVQEAPVCTTNNLKDVIDWLARGDYVVVHNGALHGRYFHAKCQGRLTKLAERDEFIDKCRVIYVDVARMPGLLDDGEWECYIKNAGNSECTCELKERLADPNGLPHAYHMKLGF